MRVAFDSPVVEAGQPCLGVGASPADFALVYRPGEEPDAATIEELTTFLDGLKEEQEATAAAAAASATPVSV